METKNLTREQTDNVLHFLLTRMGVETRCALMAEMPVAYAGLYPSVSADVILEKVRQAVQVADRE